MKPKIKTWCEFSGEAVELILNRQLEMKMKNIPKKNLGIVTNELLNEYAKILKTKK